MHCEYQVVCQVCVKGIITRIAGKVYSTEIAAQDAVKELTEISLANDIPFSSVRYYERTLICE